MLENYLVMDAYGKEVGQISRQGVDCNPLKIRPAYTIGNIITIEELERLSNGVFEKLQAIFKPIMEWITRAAAAITRAFKTWLERVDVNGLLAPPQSKTERRRLRFNNSYAFIYKQKEGSQNGQKRFTEFLRRRE